MSKKYLIRLGVVVIGLLVWLLTTIHNKNNEIEDLNNQVTDLTDNISLCSSAVDEANDNIDTLNGAIEDAKIYTWDDYDSMGDALDNLETGDTVSNPCY